MTFTINVQGHDDLEAEAKEAFENGLVSKVVALVSDIKGGAGVTLTNAKVSTNTTGEVDALADDAEPTEDDETTE
jgi:hypothetical protein